MESTLLLFRNSLFSGRPHVSKVRIGFFYFWFLSQVCLLTWDPILLMLESVEVKSKTSVRTGFAPSYLTLNKLVTSPCFGFLIYKTGIIDLLHRGAVTCNLLIFMKCFELIVFSGSDHGTITCLSSSGWSNTWQIWKMRLRTVTRLWSFPYVSFTLFFYVLIMRMSFYMDY